MARRVVKIFQDISSATSDPCYLKIYLFIEQETNTMYGMRHSESGCDGRWAAGRGRHRHGFGGWGGWRGFGGGDMVRAGRMLATGDLRLIALALIREQPRHGFEIIKGLEGKAAGWDSAGPGIVLPPPPSLGDGGNRP